MITAKDFKLIDATPEKIAELNEALIYLQRNAPKNAIPLLEDAVKTGVSIRLSDKQEPTFHPVELKNESVDANTPTMARTVKNKQAEDFTANSIDWDPHKVLIFSDATNSDIFDPSKNKPEGAISPALLLAHELAHAIDYQNNPQQFDVNNAKNSDAQYGTTNERKATTRYERNIAKELNEHQRQNHGMVRYLNDGRPTLHTIPDNNPNQKILKWQEQLAGGAIVVTGGVFDKKAGSKEKEDTANRIHDLGTYNAETKTFTTTANNTTINVAKDSQDLTIKTTGNNNSLNLSDGVNIKTDGKFALQYGDNGSRDIEGKNTIQIRDGKLTINPEVSQQNVPKDASQHHSALENANNPTSSFGQMAAIRAAEHKMAEHQIPEQYRERLQQLVASNVVAHNLSVDRVETVTRSADNALT